MLKLPTSEATNRTQISAKEKQPEKTWIETIMKETRNAAVLGLGITAGYFGNTASAADTAPVDTIIFKEDADLIELNHFYDENGKIVFDQVIFFDWSPLESHFHVREWRLLKEKAQVPVRNWKTNTYSTVWQDGDDMRELRAPAFHETWTPFDRELAEREFLPKEKRRSFIKKPAKPAAPVVAPHSEMLKPPPQAVPPVNDHTIKEMREWLFKGNNNVLKNLAEAREGMVELGKETRNKFDELLSSYLHP